MLHYHLRSVCFGKWSLLSYKGHLQCLQRFDYSTDAFTIESGSTEEVTTQLADEPGKKAMDYCLRDYECANCYSNQIRYFHFFNKDIGTQAVIKTCCSGCGRKTEYENVRDERDPQLDQFCRCRDQQSAPEFMYSVECLFDVCEKCDDDQTKVYYNDTDFETTACCPLCSEYMVSGSGISRCKCLIPDAIDGDCWKGLQCNPCRQCPGIQEAIDTVPVCCSGCKDLEMEKIKRKIGHHATAYR